MDPSADPIDSSFSNIICRLNEFGQNLLIIPPSYRFASLLLTFIPEISLFYYSFFSALYIRHYFRIPTFEPCNLLAVQSYLPILVPSLSEIDSFLATHNRILSLFISLLQGPQALGHTNSLQSIPQCSYLQYFPLICFQKLSFHCLSFSPDLCPEGYIILNNQNFPTSSLHHFLLILAIHHLFCLHFYPNISHYFLPLF